MQRFRCEALDVSPARAIVRFRPGLGAFRLAGVDLPADAVSYGLFWADRPYNVYLWVDAAGATLAAYCNVAAETAIGPEGIDWLDLEADVMIVPDGPARVLDLDEVPADLGPVHRGSLTRALARLADGAAVLAEAEAETAPYRGRAAAERAGIAPRLSVADGARALAFYKAAFGAVELERLDGDAGQVAVAHLAVGGAGFWLQHDPRARPGEAIRLILTVVRPEAAVARAVAAGASLIAPLHEEHGWRVGRIADPFGHHWEIGRPL